jgi:aspartate beta-hydroxylase
VEVLRHALQIAPENAMSYHHLGLANDAAGDLLGAVAAHREAVRLASNFHLGRLHLGLALERARLGDESIVQFSRALQDAQASGRWLNSDTTPPSLRDTVAHAVVRVREGRREAFNRIWEPLRTRYGADSLTRVERALRIHLNQEQPNYGDPRQQPTFLFMPDLPPSPYLSRDLFPWIPELESQTDAIRSELLAVLPSTKGRERVFTSEQLEQANLRGETVPPSWNGYYFYRHGERREDNCTACPMTAAALDRLPLGRIRDHGPEVLFSVFTAGTHLLPHRGITNTRLVGHLPLIVPRDCALKVADEVHEWQEGHVVVFDDTYLHEAWNRSDEIRVVMIFDIWNPHLTEAERAALTDMIASIGDFRHAVDAG